LLAAAKAAVQHRAAEEFGIDFSPMHIDRKRVQAHIAEVIEAIAPHDSVERFEGLGVTVLRSWARFIDPRTIEASDVRIRARRFALATGSVPFVPPIPGLDQVPYLTNETVFAHIAEIRDLIVPGGGSIGVELAQGFARLDTKVQLVEMASLLPRDDPEAVALVRASLVRDGVTLHEGSAAVEVQNAGDRIRLACRDDVRYARPAMGHLQRSGAGPGRADRGGGTRAAWRGYRRHKPADDRERPGTHGAAGRGVSESRLRSPGAGAGRYHRGVKGRRVAGAVVPGDGQ
jgi:pyruvate/2-oxoglutarate dehydrogenase complex dihydrolipoamide dehydrogenase (E3) component